MVYGCDTKVGTMKLVHQALSHSESDWEEHTFCWSAHVKMGYNYKQLPVQLTQTQSQITELEKRNQMTK